jgi:hypothetical protein
MVAWDGGEGRIGGSQRNQLMKALSGLKMSSAEFQVLPHLSVMNGTGLSVKGGNPWDAQPTVMSWRCTVKMTAILDTSFFSQSPFPSSLPTFRAKITQTGILRVIGLLLWFAC